MLRFKPEGLHYTQAREGGRCTWTSTAFTICRLSIFGIWSTHRADEEWKGKIAKFPDLTGRWVAGPTILISPRTRRAADRRSRDCEAALGIDTRTVGEAAVDHRFRDVSI